LFLEIQLPGNPQTYAKQKEYQKHLLLGVTMTIQSWKDKKMNQCVKNLGWRIF